MSRILKPYTIIPPHLYVKRDADRQLANIIDDMGRPGYVLVSRQMGKTNLLLNAIRELKTDDDIFLYFDLSNPYETAKDLFESIIDKILDIESEKLTKANEIILKKRDSTMNSAAHKQHLDELRQILKVIDGKLVIIFDEIDALTKADFSDEIFAQIRNIYFERVNYPQELDRLTYILSGVVEPTEIIKNPKISPFNIGDKIFLNDFTRNEFDDFLVLSKLNLSEEIKERIYYWTSGNPRITWDTCAEIEKQVIGNQVSMTANSVDEIIEKLYLTEFDKAPIDNIREMVKEDRDLRLAIDNLNNNNGHLISDTVKTKLYLTGITNFDSNSISIKNKVIEKSLSSQWLTKIIEQEQGLFGYAIEKFEKGRFEEAIVIFDKYINSFTNNSEIEDLSIVYFYLGESYYKLEKYEQAINVLDKCIFEIEENKVYFNRNYLIIALAYYNLNNYANSYINLQKIIKNKVKDEWYFRALLNYVSFKIQEDSINNREDIEQIKEEFLELKVTDKFNNEKLINDYKTIFFYNLGKFYFENKEIEKAKDILYSLLESSSNEFKPSIIIFLMELVEDKNEIIRDVEEIVNLIEKNIISIKSYEQDNPLNFTKFKLAKFLILISLFYEEKFVTILKSKSSEFVGNNSIERLFSAANHYFKYSKDFELSINFFKKLYSKKNQEEFSGSPIIWHEIIKTLLRTDSNYVNDYFENIVKIDIEKFDQLDFDIFAGKIHEHIEMNKLPSALDKIQFLNKYRINHKERDVVDFLVIDYLELQIYVKDNIAAKVISKSEQILLFVELEYIKNAQTNLLDAKGLEIIKANTILYYDHFKNRIPRVNLGIKYLPNQIVKVQFAKTGEIRIIKYKKIKDLIAKNECLIIE